MFNLSLDEAAQTYVPYSGGSSDLWPFSGLARSKIKAFTMVDLTEGKGRGLSVTFEGVEEDTIGLCSNRRYRLMGKRKDGKEQIQSLLETLQHVYEASGSTEEEAIAQVRSLSGTFTDEESFLAWLEPFIGSEVIVDLKPEAIFDKQTSAFQKWCTNVDNTVGGVRWADAQKRTDKGRTALPAEAAANQPPAAGQARRGPLPGGGAAAAPRAVGAIAGMGGPAGGVPGQRPTPANGAPPPVPGMGSAPRPGQRSGF